MLLKHLDDEAPESLLPTEDKTPQCQRSSVTEKLCCPICTLLLDRPIQLTCGAIVCLQCCQNWVMHRSSDAPLSCPCCYTHEFCSSQVRPPPGVIVSLVESLLVRCVRECGRLVKLEEYKKHLEANCRRHYQQCIHSPSKVTLKEVLEKPTTSPATVAEKRVAEHLVRIIIGITENQVFKVPTRGQASKPPLYRTILQPI